MKVLVMKVCCLGDLAFSSALAAELRRQLPDAEICWLTGAFSLPVARMIPGVDRVLEFPEASGPLGRAAFMAGLRREGFDLGFCLHKSSGAMLGFLAAGCRRSVGFRWGWQARLFSAAAAFDADAHEVDRYLALLPAAGLEAGAAEPRLEPLPADREAAADLWRERGLVGARVAGLFAAGGANPGSVMLAKRWTPEGWAQLGRFLAGRGFRLAVFGGPDDEEAARALAAACGGAEVFCAGVSLPVRTALLQRLDYLAGGDSGLTHIAAALGVPTLSLFGPTAPRHWAPRGPRHAHVWRALECSPCYLPDGGPQPRFHACPDHACLQALGADTVIEAARRQLEGLGL